MKDTWTIILTSSLISSLLSSALAATATIFLSRVNYRNEYFKKLLDKRLSAYEDVENLISSMLGMVHVGNGGQMCHLFCHLGHDHYLKFLISIQVAMRQAFWLSDKLSGAVTEFNVFLVNEISNKILEDGMKMNR